MFTLSTYNTTQFPTYNRFYILNKGQNSGKPSLMPFANSFVCDCASQQEAELVYILCYGLWQSKQFQPFLRGSVIEFITIDDLRTVLKEAFDEALLKPQFVDCVRRVLDIDRLIELRKQENKKLNNLKIALVVQHFRVKVN
jgi:hypothetical protein